MPHPDGTSEQSTTGHREGLPSASGSRLGGAGPVLHPVTVAEVNAVAAVDLAHAAVDFAAPLADIDAYPIKQLTGEIIELIHQGGAVKGVELDKLCTDTQQTRSKIDVHLNRELVIAMDLAIRALSVMGGRRVVFQELYSLPVSSRPSKAGLGADHIDNAAATLRLAGLAMGCADRHVAALEIPLTTGTRDDRFSERADKKRISGFTRELGHEVPATLAEHVEALLDLEDASRGVLAAKSGLIPDRVAAMNLSRFSNEQLGRYDTFRRFVFSNLVFAAPWPVGVPKRRRQGHDHLEALGHDGEVLELLAARGRHAILYRERLHSELNAGALTADEVRTRGFTRFHPQQTQVHQRFGLGQSFGVEWWYHQRQARLVRREVPQRPALAGGAVTDDWQLINLDDGLLDIACALIQRYSDSWPTGCLQRAGDDCNPGLIKVRRNSQEEGLRALLRLSNAALIAADRLTRASAT
jgi:hypothetical protein